ncbi:MAG TPA: glycogen debranching N-terminal domain-containing protein [Myxococcota bacterium]|nr:glycogen debranching N-terminal domain-containing protein [Myxococcota bacterium]
MNPETHTDFKILAEDGPTDERALVLARGDSFALFDHHGDLRPQPSGRHGLFFDGTRFLSLLVVRLARRRPLLLSSGPRGGNEGLSVHATNADVRDGDVLRLPRETVYLHRSIELSDGGLRLELALRSFAAVPVTLDLDFAFGADFADVFEVRGARRERRGSQSQPLIEAAAVELRYTGLDRVDRSTRLTFSEPPAAIGPDYAHYKLMLEPGGRRPLTLSVQCEIRAGEVRRYGSFARPRAARRDPPPALFIESSNPAFDGWVRRSAQDLAMMTAETAHGPFPYAGVPWFSTPFGRDALVTAFSVLWLDPGLARGVLRFLAATQSDRSDAHDDAEPGKIVHEMRGGEMAALDEVPFARYYGSVDVTPWFLLLASAYHERTGDDDLVRELWPAFHRALRWIDGPGDPDGDGFVEYLQRSPGGLANQGWKDSHDSIMHADGTLAEGPIALCEVQAYVYAAKLGMARFARQLGDLRLATQLEEDAQRLRVEFQRAFWCDDLGTYALALDGKKQPCRVRSSNAGHTLLTGIASHEQAMRVSETLFDQELFSGWGVRTLAATERRFNPMSYHNGSVWPHDNALLACGLARYGAPEAAARILHGMFDASCFMADSRLPELLCGFSRVHGEAPTLYPVACIPQAWSAASVFLTLQSVLRLSVDARRRQIRLSRPSLPGFLDRLVIRELAVDGASIDLLFERAGSEVDLRVLRQTGDLDLVLSLA